MKDPRPHTSSERLQHNILLNNFLIDLEVVNRHEELVLLRLLELEYSLLNCVSSCFVKFFCSMNIVRLCNNLSIPGWFVESLNLFDCNRVSR